MPGRPKPTHLKAIAGNPGGRPLNDKEPIPPGNLTEAPGHVVLDEVEAAELEWILSTAPPGLLRRFDAFLAVAFAQHASIRTEAREAIRARVGDDGEKLSRLLTLAKKGGFYTNPLLSIFNSQTNMMLSIAKEIGVGPAARTRIKIEEEQPKSPWAEYSRKPRA